MWACETGVFVNTGSQIGGKCSSGRGLGLFVFDAICVCFLRDIVAIRMFVCRLVILMLCDMIF